MATATANAPHANGVIANGMPAEQQAGMPPSTQGAPPTSVPPQAATSQVAMAPSYAGIPSASLYVGELDPTTTEAMLYELFNTIGQVASVRVCRDAVTKLSLGYAYVNYHNVQDGERALETLNYTPIKGKPCRIMWSQRDPSLRKSGTGNIFIKNLDSTIDNKALHDTFSAFGNILSCKVVMEENGNSKGYGFVHYETQEAADTAIASVNGMMMNDQQVYVGPHIPKKERLAKLEEQRANFTNLYIKNIPEDMTDEQLNEMFAKYGSIVSAAVKGDEQNPGKNKGFAFVNFEDHPAAKAAVDDLHDNEYQGRKLYVQRAQKKAERQDELQKKFEQAKQERLQKWEGVNLYVKNLEDDMDEKKLEQEFAQFGTIQSIKIMRDDKASSRGFGFVCYTSPEEAQRALQNMNGKMIGTKPLYVALAQRKEQRRAHLEALHSQRPPQMKPYHAMLHGVPAPMFGGGPIMYGPPGAIPQRGYYMPSIMGPRPRWQPGQPPQGPPTGPYGHQMPAPPHGPQHQGFNPNAMSLGPGARPARPRGGPPRAPVGPGRYPPPQQQRPVGKKPGPRSGPGSGAHEGGAKENTLPGNTQATNEATLPINPDDLMKMPIKDQKQMLGEAIYMRIEPLAKEDTGKVTGMFLEMDHLELLNLLGDMARLEEKVTKAVEALHQHKKGTPAK